MLPSDEWMSEANCLGVDPELFFVNPKKSSLRQQAIGASVAREVCFSCKVKYDCKKLAEREGFEGMFGGEYFEQGHRSDS